MNQSHIILICCWIVFGALHSLLAANRVKNIFQPTSTSDNGSSYYRLFYNTIAIISFLAIMLYSATIPSPKLVPEDSIRIFKFIGLAFTTWGIIVIRVAFKAYDIRRFLGLPSAAAANKVECLYTNGIFEKIRHPIYSGTLLILLGYGFYAPTITNFISILCLVIYLFVGMWLEEKKLIKEFGAEYENYRKEVPALVPKIRFGS